MKYLIFEYKNWRGQIAIRTVLPELIYYGTTEYYPEEQWLLKAFDIDKQDNRIFALNNIIKFIK